MAANINLNCPKCGKSFGLRYDPGPEDEAPMMALAQLDRECPDHDGKTWGFWDQVNGPNMD